VQSFLRRNIVRDIQHAVLLAALEVCENAALLPDCNAQIPEEISEALGDALLALQEEEQEQYQDFLAPDQQCLSSAQVAIQRAFIDERSLKIEQVLDAADQLYLAIFDEVIVPGRMYKIKASGAGIRYHSQESIKAFLEKYEDYLSS
jgi:hypothetical protein